MATETTRHIAKGHRASQPRRPPDQRAAGRKPARTQPSRRKPRREAARSAGPAAPANVESAARAAAAPAAKAAAPRKARQGRAATRTEGAPRARKPAAPMASRREDGRSDIRTARARTPPALRRRAAGSRRAPPAHDDRLIVVGPRRARRAARANWPQHTETSPALTAGDVDAKWEDAYAVGDEAPGGDNPTPDQDRVDDIGKALGVEYQDRRRTAGRRRDRRTRPPPLGARPGVVGRLAARQEEIDDV